MKKIIIIVGILLILFLIIFFLTNKSFPSSISNSKQVILTPSTGPSPNAIVDTPQTTVIATNLTIPWSIVFLPDNSMLFTERIGNVRFIDNKGQLQADPIKKFNVKTIGEGGLLGMTLHPLFSKNNYIYFYYTYNGSGNDTLNRVVRMTYQNKQLTDEVIVVDKIPGSSNHNGGRIKFGPDNLLYITTGDAENPSQAQDINALGGKILRVTDGGEVPSDNPFNNFIYSYGHRNPQGLAWNSAGQLWATEHGRSGVLSGLDELNLIQKGKNYGWPIIQGDETKVGMETPKLNSGAFTTWAPAGATFIKNSLFFGGLRGSTLYEAVINSDQITLKEHLQNQFGRIRDVVLGPDNLLYITTSNRDGRGIPSSTDDRIIKVNPAKL